jgi:hypothetical protein
VKKHLTLNYISSKKKVSLRSQLEKVWDQIGQIPPKLEELSPDVPAAGVDLWNFFWDLKTGETITWNEILSYSQYIGIEFELWQISVFFAMNAEHNKYIQEVEFPENKTPKNKPGVKR